MALKKVFSEKVAAARDMLLSLSVKQVTELGEAMEEAGVVPVTASAVVQAATPAGEAPAPAEKTTVDVMLLSIGDAKLKLIRAMKPALGMELGDAQQWLKANVVGEKPATTPLKSGVPRAEAEAIKASLEAAGASIELK